VPTGRRMGSWAAGHAGVPAAAAVLHPAHACEARGLHVDCEATKAADSRCWSKNNAADRAPAALLVTASECTCGIPGVIAAQEAEAAAAAELAAAPAPAAAGFEAVVLALAVAAATQAERQQTHPAAAHLAARSRPASTWAGRAPSGRCSAETAALQPAAGHIATMMHPCTDAGASRNTGTMRRKLYLSTEAGQRILGFLCAVLKWPLQSSLLIHPTCHHPHPRWLCAWMTAWG
jgi:hypothetical protein